MFFRKVAVVVVLLQGFTAAHIVPHLRFAAVMGFLVGPLGLALGCASVPGEYQNERITADEVLAGTPFDLENNLTELIEEDAVIAVSPEMKTFLDTNVDLKAGDIIKLRQLANAIINDNTFGLEYDDITRTASETFRAKRGNCLSFTNMFVVMARYLSLDVYFQEVDIPPDWTSDGGVSVLNRHINVFVDLGLTRDQVVDFNMDDFRSTYDMNTISNSRAMAHFNNNMGVERMLAGDTASAFRYFRRALIDNDRGFSPAWTNLATLYLREGFTALAEAGYLHALKADRLDHVAMSNLAGIYVRQGDSKRAAEYRKKVNYHRKRNPYYRYELARRAFYAKDYDVAIEHLKYAIRKRPNEDQFYFLLGLSSLRKGDMKSTRYWLGRAEEVAAQDALKQKYSNKIEKLQSELNQLD